MQLGVTLRNMGQQSMADTMRECALAVEDIGLESLWITDHIAIPPDDAEGSDGRYVDPLTTLAWMAGFTERVRLGVGVMVVPYRAPLPFAKSVAAVQELSGNRLLLGVGVGWMDAEFRALGVPRRERGRRTDETLEFLNACFAADVVIANAQPFLFKPRPPKPPILVGGSAPHALTRAARYGDGWLPMARHPQDLAGPIRRYRELTDALGRERGSVTVMTAIAENDRTAARTRVEQFEEIGVDRIVVAIRYADAAGYRSQLDVLAALHR